MKKVGKELRMLSRMCATAAATCSMLSSARLSTTESATWLCSLAGAKNRATKSGESFERAFRPVDVPNHDVRCQRAFLSLRRPS